MYIPAERWEEIYLKAALRQGTGSRRARNAGNRPPRIYSPTRRLSASRDARGYLTILFYDPAGRQIAVQDARGHFTTNLYDARGMPIGSQDALGAWTTHQFNGAGEETLRVDARGWPTTYTLDALGRTTGQQYIDGTRATFTFDAAGEQTTMQDVTGVTSYMWDNAGRQVGVVNGAGKALTYTLDSTGNRTVLLDSDGGLTSYTHDQQNRLTGIVNPFDEITTITLDALDRESAKALGNGMRVSHSYDAAGQETVLSYVTAAGAVLSWYTASYDAAGNRLNNIELDGTRVTWAYDADYQLNNEKRSGSNAYNATYLYDGVGNRTVKNDSGALTSYSYNPANELTLMQPPTGQPTTSLWDANGNLAVENAGGQLTSYSWDREDRLTGVAYPTGAPDTMSYDATGLRQKKATSAGVVGFLWDEQNVLLETDGSGVTQAHYTDFPGVWGGLSSQRRSGVSNFFGFDLQADCRIVVTQAGVISDGYLYDAFGEELEVSGSTVNFLRFGGLVGYWRDYPARLYDRMSYLRPDLGRWLSGPQSRGPRSGSGQQAYAERPAVFGGAGVRSSVMLPPGGYFVSFYNTPFQPGWDRGGTPGGLGSRPAKAGSPTGTPTGGFGCPGTVEAGRPERCGIAWKRKYTSCQDGQSETDLENVCLGNGQQTPEPVTYPTCCGYSCTQTHYRCGGDYFKCQYAGGSVDSTCATSHGVGYCTGATPPTGGSCPVCSSSPPGGM